MTARVSGKSALLAVLLLGAAIAAAPAADAAAPWYGPSGVRPVPVPGGHRGRAAGPDRDGEQNWRRRLFRERRFVRHLYLGFLNREPSPRELSHWSDRLNRDANPTELVQEFMDSDEFFIRQSYRGLLGREPDSSGMETYLGALEGGQSRADVVEALLASEEFRRKMR